MTDATRSIIVRAEARYERLIAAERAAETRARAVAVGAGERAADRMADRQRFRRQESYLARLNERRRQFTDHNPKGQHE